MWYHVPSSCWNGKAAAPMYKGALLPSLQKACPSKRRFNILEDNDPSGFKSKKGLAAKAEAKLNVVEIPPRSPDLNVYLERVNCRMRRHAREKWPKSKKWTRAQFAARLRRTAKNFSPAFSKASG